MAQCRLVVVEDQGSALTRFFHYMRADWVDIAIEIIDKKTRRSWKYKEGADVLSPGSYVIQFYVNGDRSGNMPLTVDAKSGGCLYLVIKWNSFASFMERELFTKKADFEDYAEGRSLRWLIDPNA